MAGYTTKIKLYLEANSKDYKDEKSNIEIVDDGAGLYIKNWNVSGVDKPTDSQLNTYDSAGDTRETLILLLRKRKTEYLSWEEQLDKLYHDIDDGKLDKTGSWYTHIKAVKDANSKG
tara:strand:- start:51 stop:401 length:351 start_codon:yes stop_codon:yes gene_type:complete